MWVRYVEKYQRHLSNSKFPKQASSKFYGEHRSILTCIDNEILRKICLVHTLYMPIEGIVFSKNLKLLLTITRWTPHQK